MMSHKGKMISAIAGIVVLLAASFFLLIRPRKAELAKVQKAVVAEVGETTVLQTELTRLEGLQDRAPQLQVALDQISKLVPANDEVSNFVFQVQDAADKSGLDFVDITPELPKPPPEGAQLAEVRATIGAKGDYFAIQDFIRRITEMDRAVRIDGLTMTGEEASESGDSSITLSATARIFFELPAGSTTTAPGVEPAPDTTVTDSSATTAPVN